LAQIEVLRSLGVAAEAFVWVHAQSAADDALMAAAAAGAWLSFDGLQPSTLARHLALCRLFRERGQLGQILLSHDAGWFDPAKPGGGKFRSYESLFTDFLPLLRQNGFTPQDLEQILVQNPARAFAIRKRLVASDQGQPPNR
jgi:phosphotriesterase-related protein